MENNNQESRNLTVIEKPTMSEQVVTAAVGSIATILASVIISAVVQAVQNWKTNRKAKKLAEEDIKNSKKD